MKNGFTIVELLVTIVIVSILATAAMPMAELAIRRTKEQELRGGLLQLRGALDAYKLASDQGRIPVKSGGSGYPQTLVVLVDGVVDAKDPHGAKIYFLRRLPRDPFVQDAIQPAENTWAKRSYASSADDPKEGGDVFDVYSRAPGRGLNGMLYREW